MDATYLVRITIHGIDSDDNEKGPTNKELEAVLKAAINTEWSYEEITVKAEHVDR